MIICETEKKNTRRSSVTKTPRELNKSNWVFEHLLVFTKNFNCFLFVRFSWRQRLMIHGAIAPGERDTIARPLRASLVAQRGHPASFSHSPYQCESLSVSHYIFLSQHFLSFGRFLITRSLLLQHFSLLFTKPEILQIFMLSN